MRYSKPSCFVYFTMCATKSRDERTDFPGVYMAFMPGRGLAVRGEPGEQCAVCDLAKGFSCNGLKLSR